MLAFLVSLALVQTQAPRPPNIVYVVADELGFHEWSGAGNPHLRTPNLDAMAREGMRFTQMLAGAPVCAPTRCTLMTGKHTGHSSIRANSGGTPLRADEVTIASILQTRGYATGGYGKWGCGGRGSTGVPERHGFDEFFGYYDQVHAHTYYPAYLVRNSEEVPLEGNRGGRSGATYSHYAIFAAAKAFVRAHREGPFFCYLPVTPPHGNFDIPDSDPAWAMFKDEAWPEPARRYAAMVAMLDRQLGELLALLRELQLEENTLVLFSGDNGGADYFPSPLRPRGFFGANVDPKSGVEFRGKKGDLYEGGLRVPFVARWPGKIAPGSVSTHLGYFPDLLPTLAAVAGAPVPADVDGISFLPELLGQEQRRHDALYWEHAGQVAVRAGDIKAIRPRANAAWELYDLAHDLGEAHDLAATRGDDLARLQAIAGRAHVPVQEGTWTRHDLHARDRAAKFTPDEGATQPAAQTENAWDTRGLVPASEVHLVRASSESAANGKVAANAIDGDPATFWHSRWQGGAVPHPHELVLDLGKTREITGLRYLTRQDRSWNGTVAEVEVYVADTADGFGAVGATATFRKVRTSQDATFPALRGRYVLLRTRSEVAKGPWAVIAELGVIGK